jgi:hypothetical protein
MKKLIFLATLMLALTTSCDKYSSNQEVIEDKMNFMIAYLQECVNVNSDNSKKWLSSEKIALSDLDEAVDYLDRAYQNFQKVGPTTWGECIDSLISAFETKGSIDGATTRAKLDAQKGIDLMNRWKGKYELNKLACIYGEPEIIAKDTYIVTEINSKIQFSVKWVDGVMYVEFVEASADSYLKSKI